MTDTPKALDVLLVDPHQQAARTTKEQLRQMGEFDVTVTCKHDRQGALDYLEENSPDLVLLEHELDRGTSMSLVREIRADDYRLPIVILTNQGDERICSEYFRFGVDDYRVKEKLKPDILHTTIKYALTRRTKKVQQKHAAKFDELTNLYNRRFTFRRIREELTHATRHELPFSLCLMDLDGFKQINDTHGHLAGDYLLKSVGDRIQDSVRSGDVVGRFGGDEFIVGLRNTDSDGAYHAAEKLVSVIRDEAFELPSGNTVNVGCSVGVAEFDGSRSHESQDRETVEALVNRADQALYRAKDDEERAVERRRHRRYGVDKPVTVNIRDGEGTFSADLRNYSRRGVQLTDLPGLEAGEEIQLSLEWNGSTIERQGVIRSCKQMENSSTSLVGVEVQRELPEQLIGEADVEEPLVS